MPDIYPTIPEFDPHADHNLIETPETVADLKTRIAQLESQLKDNVDGGLKTIVETPTGSVTLKQLAEELDEMREEQELTRLRSQRVLDEHEQLHLARRSRLDGSVEYRPSNEDNRALFPSDADVTQLMGGLNHFAKLTPEQKAQARDIRASDLRDHPCEIYFGKDTSAEAHALGQRNLPLYRAVREIAVRKGLVG